MCWTARYQDTAKRSWEIYPIGFLVPWSASCSDKNPRCNELQLGMVHELLVQGLCCNFWYGMEGEGLYKVSLTFDGGINRFLLCTCMVSMFSAIAATIMDWALEVLIGLMVWFHSPFLVEGVCLFWLCRIRFLKLFKVLMVQVEFAKKLMAKPGGEYPLRMLWKYI